MVGLWLRVAMTVIIAASFAPFARAGSPQGSDREVKRSYRAGNGVGNVYFNCRVIKPLGTCAIVPVSRGETHFEIDVSDMSGLPVKVVVSSEPFGAAQPGEIMRFCGSSPRPLSLKKLGALETGHLVVNITRGHTDCPGAPTAGTFNITLHRSARD